MVGIHPYEPFGLSIKWSINDFQHSSIRSIQFQPFVPEFGSVPKNCSNLFSSLFVRYQDAVPLCHLPLPLTITVPHHLHKHHTPNSTGAGYMGRRNHLARIRLGSAMKDGEWRTAAEIAAIFRLNGWSYTSTNQIGNLCSRSPGWISRRSGGVTSILCYKFENHVVYYNFVHRR
jgi:hypothetical protein